MSKMKLSLATKEAIRTFLDVMNSQEDNYILENENGNVRVDAKSMLGVLYATTECGQTFFLMNTTNDGVFPTGFDGYHQF